MQSGNYETYIRNYNYIDSLSCYENIKQNILTKLKENERRMIYLKKFFVSDNLVTDYFWMSMSHFCLPVL